MKWLTPAEAALETVWYRTSSLQRHTQRVRPRFSAEEFLEFIGVAALANAVCRLSAVADDRSPPSRCHRALFSPPGSARSSPVSATPSGASRRSGRRTMPWRAALAMREALEEYNGELTLAGQPALRVGIGLHRGVAVAGVIGSEELVEFTVIGSTVNLASRVEHLTPRHAADILIAAAVREGLDAHFALQELPAAAVAGISEPSSVTPSRAFCPADRMAISFHQGPVARSEK
jgi:class 3 adenylate cyclase